MSPGSALIEVCQPGPEHRDIILNLGVYFRYDLLPFLNHGDGSRLNRFGTIGADASRTHGQSIAEQEIWWSKPGILLPMLIRVDKEPVEFAQVARPPHAHPSVNYRMEDLFIVNKFRRLGVGRLAVAEIFARYSGRWEVGWAPNNRPAELFWRRVTSPWQPEDWLVQQAPGSPDLPGLRLNTGRA